MELLQHRSQRRALIIAEHTLPRPAKVAADQRHFAAAGTLGKVLVANRGEIAKRIFRAAKGLGLATAAVYAEPDAKAHHPFCADEAFLIPTRPEHNGNPVAPYLDIESIIGICKERGVKAVHPGYGFLAENEDFAKRLLEEGITFIGPRPEHLALFGDKTRARAFAVQAGVPVLPGSSLCQTLEEAKAYLKSQGTSLQWPLLIKAAKGGGGRGQRVVRSPEELGDSFSRCSQEALLGFGDGGCFVEEFLERARHIEIQVIGDGKGRCVHLFERDCSVQLRNQKVVEIAPARGICPELRDRIAGAAIRLCEACKYLNAGTVEFLVEGDLANPDARFIFLEVNPRVQVEHTITEEVTGLDIVRTQLLVAAGEGLEAALGLERPAAPRGWAIQARVALQPSGAGVLSRYAEPKGPGIRIDSGVAEGVTVPAEYDSMIMKVICFVPEGQSFNQCAKLTIETLKALRLEGIRVNIDMLVRILEDEVFASGEVYTRYLTDRPWLVTGVRPAEQGSVGAGDLVKIQAPFHGQISEVRVRPGDKVTARSTVLVLNAMKMLNDVPAGVAGEVKEVHVKLQDQVAEGQVLIVVEASGVSEKEESHHEIPPAPARKVQELVTGTSPASSSRRPTAAWYAKNEEAESFLDPTAPALRSRVQRDEVFQKRAEHNKKLLEELQKWNDWAHGGGSPENVAEHRSSKKLMPLERIQRLLDPATSLLELTPLAAWGRYKGTVPGGGLVAGIGLIFGRECMLIANDPTVPGAATSSEGSRKLLRAQEIAEQNHLPCVYLVDGDTVASAGGAEVKNVAVLSSKRIPQVACVLGKCSGSTAHITAICDETVAVKGQAAIWLKGSVPASPDEDVGSREHLSAALHTAKTGLVDHLADSEQEALGKVRNIVAYLAGRRGKAEILGMAVPEEPLYDPEELLGIIPEDTKIPFDVREVIARVVDGSRFHEFRPRYGATIVCGFAHIEGYPVGILGNNGMLFSESAKKATHFIQVCGHRGIPLVFLHNITGFIIGTEYERGGITKDGAKMITAVSCVPVPKFSVVLAGSHGAGNYAMAGPAYDPRFTWLWPNAKISVMGGEQAAGVIAYVKNKQLKREGKPELTQEQIDFLKAPIVQAYEASSSAFHSSSGVFDDGIIDPRLTRQYLARGISVAMNAPLQEGEYGVFRL